MNGAEISEQACTHERLARTYGGFSVAHMELALPMLTIREVMPKARCVPLPCPSPYIIGGLEVRGVLIPVLDLHRVVRAEANPSSGTVVIVMVWEGRLLGILADAVRGIFTVDAKAIHAVHASDEVPSVYFGSVQPPGDHPLVNLLNPQALARLPQVPMTDDPEPERQRLLDELESEVQPSADVQAHAQGAGAADGTESLMMLQCGHAALAIPAVAVQTTLSDPHIQSNALEGGHYRGVTEYDGWMIPVVDLAPFCGFEGPAPASRRQAFVVSLSNQKKLAFLVDRVKDVVHARCDSVVPIPAFAMRCAGLFKGLLERSSVTEYSTLPDDAHMPTQYHVLSPQAIEHHPELLGLSSTRVPAQGAATSTDIDAAGAPLADARSMVTYLLHAEVATPIDQVEEILPFDVRVCSAKAGAHAVLGMMVHHGRCIPLVDLGWMRDGHALCPGEHTSVLVVRREEQCVGFAVSGLKSIEKALWEPKVPVLGARGTGQTSSQSSHQALARVGEGQDQRLLQVVDLREWMGRVLAAV